MKCPLCGFEFDPEEARACNQCPLQRACTMICCPHCGYQMVDVRGLRVARWLERVLGVKRKA